MKIANKIEVLVLGALGLVFLYVSLVPFYYFQAQSLEMKTSFSLVKYFPFLLICGAVGLWAIEWRRKAKPLIPMAVDRFIVLALAVALLSLLGATYAFKGLEKWVYYNMTGPALCFLAVQYGTSWARIRGAALFMALVSGVVVVYTFCFGITGFEPVWDAIQRAYSPYYTRHRAMGPFGHTVATASYTMLLLPLAVWGVFALGRGWQKIGWSAIAALYVPVVLLTQTRGAQLATVLCCALMAPWLRKVGPALGRIGRRSLYGGLVLGGLAALVLGEGLLQRARVGDVFVEIGQRWGEILASHPVEVRDGDKVYRYDSMLEYTERFRIAQYYTVGKILAEHPLLGVGFGTFTREFEKYRYDENYMVREFPEHTTENMYLMFLAETGVLGLLARLGLMAAICTAVFRAWRRAEAGPRRELLWAYLAGAAGLAFNMLTWDVLNEPTMRMAYWLWTGLALGAARMEGVGQGQPSGVEVPDDAV